MPDRPEKPIHFVMCSCGHHGCFVSRGYRSKELYTRAEVDHYLLLYLLSEKINYEEVDRTLKEMDRVKFSNTPRVCLLPRALP